MGKNSVTVNRREQLRLNSVPRRWPAALSVLLIASWILLSSDPPSLRADTFTIRSMVPVEGGVLLSHDADPSAYYQLQESVDMGEWHTSSVGLSPPHAWDWPTDGAPASRLLRLRRIPRTAPDDADLDGLDDLQELLSSGTDPLDPDSDRDGRPDGMEQALHTDPLNGDVQGPVVTLAAPASGAVTLRIP